MDEFTHALRLALSLIAGLDPELVGIVRLSLEVSLSATAIALALGAPAGAALALRDFPGRSAVIVWLNGALGLPPVVVGLVVYLLLSRSGPFGAFGLLFTPGAMIIAQTMLTLPIVAALVHRTSESIWSQFGDALRMFGASLSQAIVTILALGRVGLLTAFLAAFGRAVAEVGAIILVGGNIRGSTRTMTTAIALETSKGDLALALALGFILIALTLSVSAIVFALNRRVLPVD